MAEQMLCRGCGAVVIARDDALIGKRAFSGKDLAFVCDGCGRSYSNSRLESARVEIARSPATNVPDEVAFGLEAVLAAACNKNARGGKAWKFRSERSEDPVSWTVIQALLLTGQLARVADALNASATGTPHLLFWGVAFPAGDLAADELASGLEQVSRDLGEEPDRRSEPDIIIAWDDLLVVVEAKLGSANDGQIARLDRFDRYLGQGMWTASATEIKRAGLYELVRNWSIGWLLAERSGRSTFVLANLAPVNRALDVDEFARLCATSPSRRVAHVRWRDLLPDPQPQWLQPYVQLRQLESI